MLAGMGTFAEDYPALTPSEQAQFSEALRMLLAEGLIWRGDESRRATYNFLGRHSDLVKDYLGIAGWQLLHHEQSQIFQVVHRDGAHRLRLKLDTTICLLLLRMLYAEQRESLTLRLTTYPAVTVGEIHQRYHELPNSRRRWKSKLEESLRELQQRSLIRAVGGGSLRVGNPQQVVELLPTLEVVVPAGTLQQLSERLATYLPSGGAGDDEENEGEADE